MRKAKRIGIAFACVLAACSGAQVVGPAGTGAKQFEPIPGPFSLCWCLAAPLVMQADVCAIVELQGPAVRLAVDGKESGDRKISVPLRQFDVKIVEGPGLKAGEVYHCFSQKTDPRPITGGSNRYLLLGWSNKGTDRLAVEPFTEYNARMKTPPLNVECEPRTLYALALLPTKQAHVVNGRSDGGRVYLNMADLLAKGALPVPLRQVTDQLLGVQPMQIDREASIEGQVPYDWVTANVRPVLARMPLITALERLRIGGLLASWDRPKRALAYLRDLPVLMKELGLTNEEEDRKGKSGRSDWTLDLMFIASLDLFTGVDPNEILKVVWEYPMLRAMALDCRLGRPSLENQQKILQFIDDPVLHTRARALDQFARWYAKWDMFANPHWSVAAQGEVIDNEDALRNYWRNKIGGPTPP